MKTNVMKAVCIAVVVALAVLLVYTQVLAVEEQKTVRQVSSNSGNNSNAGNKNTNDINLNDWLIKKADNNFLALIILIFIILDRSGLIDIKKILGGRKNNPGNPHSLEYYEKIGKKIGYHDTEISIIKKSLDTLRDDFRRIETVIYSMRDCIREMRTAHMRNHPDDDITKVK